MLSDPDFDGPTLQQYRGDFQMHSEWSDGVPSVEQIADACLARGYQYAAVTDHSHGLKIAGGMSMADAAEQRVAIERVNARSRSRGATFTPPKGGRSDRADVDGHPARIGAGPRASARPDHWFAPWRIG